MAIQTIQIDDKGNIARMVEVNPDQNIQACRVQFGPDEDANELWFFDPKNDVADSSLIGVVIDRAIMKSDPVILRFNTSAAILPIINDLAIIYGNLVKAGL